MRNLTLILFIWTLTLGKVWANDLCDQAGITSLSLGEQGNSCLKPDESLSAVEKKTLLQIISIHQDVARLFHVTTSDLFSYPLKIDISEYALGPFVSSASIKQISLGVYPRDGFDINVGVYLHELGHVLAGSKNPKLPKVLFALDESVLFSETFADFLALTIHGNVITPAAIPTCLDRLRFITSFQTYNYPMAYFESFSEARMRKCCDSLVKHGAEEKYLNLCEIAKDWFRAEIDLSTEFGRINRKLMDDHQIGIPVLSFLKHFSEKTQISFRDIFERMFFSVNTSENILQVLRLTLSPGEVQIFDELYEYHAIDKGLRALKDSGPQL